MKILVTLEDGSVKEYSGLHWIELSDTYSGLDGDCAEDGALTALNQGNRIVKVEALSTDIKHAKKEG